MVETELYFPFDAVYDGNNIPDRLYRAADFARYFSQFISNGVYPNPSNGLLVQSLNSNMVVTVRAGSGFVNGYTYIAFDNFPVTVNASNASYNRKDNIVLQLNLTERWIDFVYKAGTASASPIAPVLVRNDDIYELKLAEILVRAGTSVILTSDITDYRLNSTVCGIVHAVVDTVDTTAIFNQYENYLNQKIAEWDTTKTQQGLDFDAQLESQQTEFDSRQTEIQAWYDGIKTEISKLQTFDFDNLTSFPGCTLTPTKTADSYVDTITFTATNKKVADRTETKTATEYITVTRVYNEDGVTVDKMTTITENKTDYRTVIV